MADQKNKDALSLADAFVENTGCHVFLTGKAGTGKTTFLKNLKQTTDKRMIVTAPTGVAAINAGGVTLHSFFQLPFGPFVPGRERSDQMRQRMFRFSKEKKQIIRSLDLLVIDEVSMVRADVMDAVDAVLRYHRRSSLPFGGVQLLLIGDLHQLPPVAKPDEWNLLGQYYDSVYFFSSHAVRQINLNSIELEKIHRQTDEAFIHLLNQVRENRLDPDALDRLNQRVNRGFVPADQDGYIMLTTHNRMADTINQEKLAALKSPVHELDADISGEFSEQNFPTFPKLSLKKGAQVMFLRNDTSPEKQYYNGKIGRIAFISKSMIQVVCPDQSEPITVEPVEWENIKYTVNEETREIHEEIIGRFRQFPLKPAWAITIHKSQGLTFDKAVIDTEAAFAQGQVYVALSRCRTLDGLVLSSPVPAQGITVDEAVSRFLETSMQGPDLSSGLGVETTRYQQQMLMNCFSFHELNGKLEYLFRLINQNRSVVQVSGVSNWEQLQEIFRKDIFQVSENFKRQLSRHFTADRLPEEDPYLRDRVKKAFQWFAPRLSTLFHDITETMEMETDNKVLRKKLKNAAENLRHELTLRRAGIGSCETGFSPSQYLQAVSAAEVDFSCRKPVKKKAVTYTESDITHPELFRQMKAWRLKLAKEKNVPAYHILHQKVLIQIVIHLPVDEKELEAISGVGPRTMESHGADLLEMVQAYRNAHDVDTVTLPEKETVPEPDPGSTGKKQKGDSRNLSLSFFNQGCDIPEIAEKRGLAEKTILGHLTDCIRVGELGVERLLSEKKQAVILAALSRQSDRSLKLLKEDLGDEISYDDIKLMIARVTFLDN